MDLKQAIASVNKLVEPSIVDLLSHGVQAENVELSNYQCSVGGKRIRPFLVMISGLACDGNTDDMVRPAASVEILHNATLIADDIIDHSEFRRNKPTCYIRYGKSIAECISFTYIASAYEGLVGAKNSEELVALFSSTLKNIIDGEIEDILFERSGRQDEKYVVANRYGDISKDDYLQMIGNKTAVLLRASCMTGAICAGGNEEQVRLLGDFGFNLGLVFQIRDDILDIYGDEKQFGKKIGKDIIEKKMGNIVILTAFDELNAEQINFVTNLFKGSDPISDADVDKIAKIIDSTNARQKVEHMAERLTDRALESLNQLSKNKYISILEELAYYIAHREV